MMISIVCCYNNKEQYEEMCSSLKKSNAHYEIIGIDNTDNKFESAAKALNFGATLSNGQYLVFLHQDILFNSEDSLANFVDSISNIENNSIIGLYGAARRKEQYSNNLYIVDTLDECCIAMKKEVWEKYRFNEIICDNWHLYVVELCLRVKRDKGLIVTGKFDIVHLSDGNVNEKYMETMKKLIVEYKDFDWITTTCKAMPTSLVYFNLYYILWKLKKILLGNYHLMAKLRRKER